MRLSLNTVRCNVDAVGFRGVEFGSEVVLQYGKEVLVAAKDAAGVEVVNMSTALGELLHR